MRKILTCGGKCVSIFCKEVQEFQCCCTCPIFAKCSNAYHFLKTNENEPCTPDTWEECEHADLVEGE